MKQDERVAPRIIGAEDDDIDACDDCYNGEVLEAAKLATLATLGATARAKAFVWLVAALCAWLSFFASGWLYMFGRLTDWTGVLMWGILSMLLMLAAPKAGQ